MSLINDALNKVQRQRGEKLPADLAAHYEGPQASGKRKSSSRFPPAAWVAINAVVLIAILAGNHFFTRNLPAGTRPASDSRSAETPAAAVQSPVVRPAPLSVAESDSPRYRTPRSTSSPKTVAAASPFRPPSEPDANAEDVEYDLAGMTSVGKDTLLSVVRRSDQRSFWIPVGKTVGEVTAVSYNADSDNAVIRVRGKLFTIVMRHAAVYFRPVTAPTK